MTFNILHLFFLNDSRDPSITRKKRSESKISIFKRAITGEIKSIRHANLTEKQTWKNHATKKEKHIPFLFAYAQKQEREKKRITAPRFDKQCRTFCAFFRFAAHNIPTGKRNEKRKMEAKKEAVGISGGPY